jgi:hypothetical protein
VARVGAGRIRQAAQAIATVSNGRDIPPETWPQALRDLGPKSIAVDADCVMVWMSVGYVEGDALCVLREGAEPLKEGSGDPSVWRVADGIYLLEFVG